MESADANARIVRDADYAERLQKACDANPNVPPHNKGRGTWFVEQFAKRYKMKISSESVRRWFYGEVRPRQDKNAHIAELLDVDAIWLFHGIEPTLSAREKRVRNALADGAVNVVAGLIQMDGASPAFPDATDKRASKEHIDIYAVIKGAQYSIHVAVGELKDDQWKFVTPVLDFEQIVVLGLARQGTTFYIVPITQEVVQQHGDNTLSSTKIVIPSAEIPKLALSGFSERF